jgi:hypothetical protein
MTTQAEQGNQEFSRVQPKGSWEIPRKLYHFSIGNKVKIQACCQYPNVFQQVFYLFSYTISVMEQERLYQFLVQSCLLF